MTEKKEMLFDFFLQLASEKGVSEEHLREKFTGSRSLLWDQANKLSMDESAAMLCLSKDVVRKTIKRDFDRMFPTLN